jgi:hypothetical protein
MTQRYNKYAQKTCIDGETDMQAMRKTNLMDRLAHSLGNAFLLAALPVAAIALIIQGF